MLTKSQFSAILSTLEPGNYVSADFSGAEKMHSGFYSVVSKRVGPGRGGVLWVKLRAKNGTEFEISASRHGACCESLTVGYGSVEIAKISHVASMVGSTARLPLNS